MLENPQVRFGGGQKKKEQQCHLVGWLPTFDHIDHQALLGKLRTYPAMRHLVKGWLNAGVMEGLDFSPTPAGTPQGGVVSPLLMNRALHGMEEALVKAYVDGKKAPCARRGAPKLIRYTDDFVVLHTEETEGIKAQQLIAAWLQGIGLELKPSKTRLSHTLKEYQGNVGFNFLGFTIRQFPVGKTHTGRTSKGQPLGFKTLILPSKEGVQRHVQARRQDTTEESSALSRATHRPVEPDYSRLDVVLSYGRFRQAIRGLRPSSDADALAKDDPKTPQQKRHMGERALLANSAGQYLDIRYTRGRRNEAYPPTTWLNTHPTPHQGKRPSQPV
jgi:reverse transcriptase-like protein